MLNLKMVVARFFLQNIITVRNTQAQNMCIAAWDFKNISISIEKNKEILKSFTLSIKNCLIYSRVILYRIFWSLTSVPRYYNVFIVYIFYNIGLILSSHCLHIIHTHCLHIIHIHCLHTHCLHTHCLHTHCLHKHCLHTHWVILHDSPVFCFILNIEFLLLLCMRTLLIGVKIGLIPNSLGCG